ncbi:MAG: hypothetical protein KF914_10060 [Rhizobiaceae bacterium]|nr:hypothetical protein [Rhizobiaceae bacterium]
MALAMSEMLRREFAVRAEAAAYERFRQRELDDRKRRDRENSAERGADDSMDIALAVISVAEADHFRVELDTHDAATVEALQINDAQLVQARARLEKLFAKAHVLPDGRRVFKTEDGTRVFDENGQELRSEQIDPGEIGDERPRWEAAKTVIEENKALEKERADILDYQQKLDEARKRLDAGDMTKGEFDQLRKELKAEMPDAVREVLPEHAKEPAVQADANAAIDIELDIADDMVPTAAAPKPPMPGMPG